MAVPVFTRKQNPVFQNIQGVKIYTDQDIKEEKVIGKGSFAEVTKGMFIENKKTIAIKKLSTTNILQQKLFVKEINLLKELDHENIVKLEGVNIKSSALLVEYCSFDFKPFNDSKVVNTLEQLLHEVDQSMDFRGFENVVVHAAHGVGNGLAYLHEHGIVHRDLKPSNILVSNEHYSLGDTDNISMQFKDSPVIVKLTDFGESRSTLIQTKTLNTTACSSTYDIKRGTTVFQAPEIHTLSQTSKTSMEALQQIDMWAFGMTLWCLVNSDLGFPYAAEVEDAVHCGKVKNHQAYVIDLLKKGDLPRQSDKYKEQKRGFWAKIVRIMNSCLKYNPRDRISAQEASICLDPHMERLHCAVDQNSIDEARDSALVTGGFLNPNDDRGSLNACTFLAILIGDKVQSGLEGLTPQQLQEFTNDTILEFPQAVNQARSGRMYDVEEAMKLLQTTKSLKVSYQLTDLVPAYTELSRHDAENELVQAMKAIINVNRQCCAIYTGNSYTLLLIFHRDRICFVDTHPVGQLHGGGGHAMICWSKANLRGCLSIARWLLGRISCGRVQHNLVEMVPICGSRMSTSNITEACHSPHSSPFSPKNTSPTLPTHQSGEGILNTTLTSHISITSNSDDTVTSQKSHSSHSTKDSRSKSKTNSNSLTLCSIDGSSETSHESEPLNERVTDFSITHWTDCNVTDIENFEIPFNVDGLQKFRMECDKSMMMTVSKDGRKWGTWMNSSRKNFSGVRRIAHCKGSHVCHQESCKLDGKSNDVQFTSAKGYKVCGICGSVPQYVPCEGKKVWEHNGTSSLTIFYRGTHTCPAIKKATTRKSIQKELEARPGVTPSRIILNKMADLMQTEGTVDWDRVQCVADQFVDMKAMHNEKSAIQDQQYFHGHSFDAVCKFKDETDKRDKFLVYKVNNGRMNNGHPSYVFKSSKAMAEIALQIDRDRDGPLQHSYIHVDAKHDRVRHMKTLTMWVDHPVYRKVLCLAVMDVERENHENLVLFWTTFVQMLAELTGNKSYIFNPHGIVVDEHPANWSSIEKVLGPEVVRHRTVSCEFHFKQSMVKHSHKVKDKTIFKQIATSMLEACSQREYETFYVEMLNFSAQNGGCLDDWAKWWHKRRHHIFKAFKDLDAPTTNIAEIGHAQMGNTSDSHMLLIKACQLDVSHAIRQEATLQAISAGTAPLGKCANVQKRKRASYKKQMKFAKECIRDLDLTGKREEQRKTKHRPITTEISRRLGEGGSMEAPPPKRSKPNMRREILPLTPAEIQEQERQCFVVAFRFGRVSRCFGCGGNIKAGHNPPHDIVLRRRDFRVFYNPKAQRYQRKLEYTYYDFDMRCVRLKFADTQVEDIVVYTDTQFQASHIEKLHAFGIHKLCEHD